MPFRGSIENLGKLVDYALLRKDIDENREQLVVLARFDTENAVERRDRRWVCLLYTSDAADEE